MNNPTKLWWQVRIEEQQDEIDRLKAELAHHRKAADLWMGLADERQKEIDRLRTAIRKHRDQINDDRCWLDDLELYLSLGPEEPVKPAELPPKCEFLKSCERYWTQRQPWASRKESPAPGDMTLAQLEADNARLRTLNMELVASQEGKA